MRVLRLLLASHGTAGARGAEAAALELLSSASTLAHLHVVPGLWRGMMGDDWLNNASTRDTYGRHIESELAGEVEEVRQRLEDAALKRGARREHRVVVGDPAECLVAYAAEFNPELIVMGSRRPARLQGLRSRMDVERLMKSLDAPLLVIPFPK